MSWRNEHNTRVEQLKKQFLQRNSKVALRSTSSNTTRHASYKQHAFNISINHFNHILHVDTEKQVAYVEPKVTMEELLKATLKHGLQPAVLPEFKSITVGGAIMGAAAESTSHLYGQFNDSCLAYEVLLGNGTITRASPKENSDLFYGLAGSYGSLGLLLLVEISLIKTSKYIELSLLPFTDTQEALNYLTTSLQNKSQPQYLDGIIFSQNHAVIIEGRPSETKTKPHLRQHFLSPWYFQSIKKVKSPSKVTMPTKEYLFRYDKGAFWMGSYLLFPKILFKYVFEGVLKFKASKWLEEKDLPQLNNLKGPSLFTRFFLGCALSSKVLYSLLHKQAEQWVADRFVIQDLCMPDHHAKDFLTYLHKTSPIYPLWLCPIKGSKNPQFLSPNFIAEKAVHTFIINFGLYGIPGSLQPVPEMTKQLEQEVKLLGGRKVLYSHSYYTQEEFWSIYPKEKYTALQSKFHAEDAFLPIEVKVLNINK